MSDKNDPEVFLPSSTYPEAILETIQNITSLVPVLGGPTSNFFGGMAAGRKFERIREVLLGVAQDLQEFKDQIPEEYIRSEDFEDILEETLRRTARERSQEKRKLYRSFLSKESRSPVEYDTQLMVLKTIEELQAADLVILEAIFREPHQSELNGAVTGSLIGTIRRRIPGTENYVIETAVERFDRLGITDNVSNSLKTMMTPHGAVDLRTRLTSLGKLIADYFEHS